jgi:hypothetical protein
MSFSNASQGISLPGGTLAWRGGSVSGTAPTGLIITTANVNHFMEATGIDLSALSGKSLVTVSATLATDIRFRSCKLPASFTALNGVIPGNAFRVQMDNCASGDNNWYAARYSYEGSVVADNTRYRQGGASDGTTPLSHQFVTLAGATLYNPLEGIWATTWNDVRDGSIKTITAEICVDGATLFDDDVFLEVEYPGTSNPSIAPQAVTINTRCNADVATHQSLPARFGSTSATWTGFTTPMPQRLQAGVIPTQKGPIRARVCVAKPNLSTIWVDPMITVT